MFQSLISLVNYQPHLFLSSYDIANDTVVEELGRFSNQCRNACKAPDCHESYSITSGLPEATSSQTLKFSVEVPREPSFTVNYHPKVQFIEFAVYVLSCFGTWFGISALHLNPFRLKLTDLKKPSDGSCNSCDRLLREQLQISRSYDQLKMLVVVLSKHCFENQQMIDNQSKSNKHLDIGDFGFEQSSRTNCDSNQRVSFK